MRQSKRSSIKKIRVISGQWRGRKLSVSNNSGIRPTTSRMRTILFNWLSQSVVNSRCLDCFAGSGSLGIEALSRYACNTTFLEINYGIARQIQKNILLLKTKRARVLNVNTLSFLSKKGRPYDIVFVDPPFRKGLVEETLNLLEKNEWLKTGSLVYIENEIGNNLTIPTSWKLHRERKIGQSSCHLYCCRWYEEIMLKTRFI